MNQRPGADEYHPYYSTYVDKVPDGDIVPLLEQQIGELRKLLDPVDDARAAVPDPPYTWTIKQVVGHLIDAERLFGNRLFHFASGDQQPLPGMDQGPYVDNADYDAPSLRALTDELEWCRRSNLAFIRRMTPAAWERAGVADGKPITVRALAWILAGHIQHHLEIVQQRLA